MRRGGPTDVPFIPEQRIERDADLLIEEFAVARGIVVNGPAVPVEEILEIHLGLALEFDDLCALMGCDGVLGAIWFEQRVVRVDVRLDPTPRPQLLGRFRFTLAHEIGHWRLHRNLFRSDPSQSHLFGGRGQPAFVCRSTDTPPVEWQANAYAAALLMPRRLLLPEWPLFRGDDRPLLLEELPPSPEPPEARMNHAVRPIAERFAVSPDAMRIRLENLGLLLRERPNTLF